MKEDLIARNRISFARICLLGSALCTFCAFAVDLPAQDFKTVHNGVEYAQVQHKVGNDSVKVNLLRLDLTKVRLDVHHAMDAAVGTEKTSSIATRHGAVAAINAGFFRLDTSIWAGEDVGTLMIDYRLLSEPSSNRSNLLLANLPKQTITAFARPNGGLVINATSPICGVDRERKDTDIVVYTSEFGPTTRTRPGGTEIVLKGCRGMCSSTEVFEGAGDTQIPAGGYVISIGPTPNEEQVKFINSMKASKGWADVRSLLTNIDTALPFEDKNYAPEDAVAGVPQLIKNGKIDITWEQEKASKSFVETRHPRTAVAKLKDGKFLMVTVDGRQPGVSAGMNLYELADYLLSIGAVDAMNLDGGGSTTMFLDGKVVNTPSDKEGERKVGDAILVTLRKVQEPPRK